MKRIFSCWVILLLVAFGISQTANAAVMSGGAYEPFNYAADTQIIAANNLNAGLGWNATGDVNAPNGATNNWGNAAALPGPSGAASNPGKTVGAATLSFMAVGYPASKGGKAVNDATLGGAGNSTVNVSRHMGQDVDSGTFYFSYLTDRNTDSHRTTSLSFFGTPVPASVAPLSQQERFAIGQIGTGTATNAMTNGNLALFFNNSQPGGVLNAATPIPYGTGVTHLIVGKIEWNTGPANLFGTIAGNNERVTLWVDPADVTSEAAAGTPYIQTDLFEIASINSIRLFSGNQAAAVGPPHDHPIKPPANADYDEIRIGGTWAAAITTVPEPGALVLLGMASTILAGFRRRVA